MKGLAQITRIMNKFMAEHDIDCRCQIGSEFCYCYPNSLITYTLIGLPYTEDFFLNCFINLGLEYTCDVFLISWFHEVGHWATLDDIDDDWYQVSQLRKEELAERRYKSIKDLYKIQSEYWRLADEKEANKWAVNFMNENYEDIRKMWEEKLQPAILNFYKLNGLI